MPAIPLIAAAATAYGTVKSVSAQKKAGRRANQAAEAARVDPAEVVRLARETASDNIRNSLALEQQYTPENAAFRQGSMQQLLGALGADPTGDQAIESIRGLLAQPQAGEAPMSVATDPSLSSARSPLLQRALQMASDDLQLGGALPQDVRNEVARNAIATSGRVGGGNLGLSRFIAPRDLGVSSLALRDNRLNRASQLGQQDFGNQLNLAQQRFSNTQQNRVIGENERSNRVGEANQATQLRSQLATLLSNLGSNQFNRYLSGASFGQTLQPPESGLSPGDVASLFVQNASNSAQAGINAAQLQAQTGRNTAQAFGGLGGLVSGIDWGRIFNRSGASGANTGYLGDMNNATTG